MNEVIYISICLKEIAKKTGWESPSEWSDSDFRRLAERIRAKTTISISVQRYSLIIKIGMTLSIKTQPKMLVPLQKIRRRKISPHNKHKQET
jgi:hypothetical protein